MRIDWSEPAILDLEGIKEFIQFVLVRDHDLFFKQGKDIGDLIRYIQYSTFDESLFNHDIPRNLVKYFLD